MKYLKHFESTNPNEEITDIIFEILLDKVTINFEKTYYKEYTYEVDNQSILDSASDIKREFDKDDLVDLEYLLDDIRFYINNASIIKGDIPMSVYSVASDTVFETLKQYIPNFEENYLIEKDTKKYNI